MNERTELEMDEQLQTWVKTQLDQAVKQLMADGVAKGLLVEAKPAWAFPFQILVGKIRDREQSDEYNWFICGDLPTDHIPSSQASSPRDAARHFALKWQLDAARREPLDQELVKRAEALYELVNEDSLWVTG
jgi:hypothetical protein